jgi:hypothetical protein
MADARTSTATPSPQTDTAQNERGRHEPERTPQPPPAPSEQAPPNRLLWTPTPGQDVTKSLFPLNKTAVKP